jgi:subtilisin family serine protease
VVLGGVSLLVPRSEVHLLENVPGVVAVYPDTLLQPVTERSPAFLGATEIWEDLGGSATAGEGVVVGVIDSGIWPEHPSFADPDPSGAAYPAPPFVPGSCDFGNDAYNPNDADFTCNNKLIGAYTFLDTYKAVEGLLPEEFDSARDDSGHGTHTASTAAGNFGVESSVFGVPRGTASGIAPRAHVVAYRVCGDAGCYVSDSLAAVQQAIIDGVDAVNFSISGGANPYGDSVELGFLAAYEAGVFVAASAGNAGPAADTTDHRGPWTTTVAASTTDRHFLSELTLTASGADPLILTGATVTDGISVPTAVVFPPAGEELCLDPFPAGTFAGEIVICRRGTNARVAKGFNVAEGGAGGMILYNPSLQGLATDNHFIPSVHLEVDSGAELLDFMAAHTGVMASFTQGTVADVEGDVMAAFSSRGGPGQTLGVSKPDVTAPGVQILAGHTPLPATVEGGLAGELFQVIQGTSMSSPHVAGAGALLKDIHPDWKPGQIKSALMTTARRRVFKEDGVTLADPFDFGSGRIDLRSAGDPGLTFNERALRYLNLETNLWDANYPSLYLPANPGEVTVRRSVKSELPYYAEWQTRVTSPSDLDVTVPDTLRIRPGRGARFKITVDARNVPEGETRFANLRLKSGPYEANFPITVVRRDVSVTLDKSCAPTALARGEATECTLTLQNTTFDPAAVHLTDVLPGELDLVNGSVVGGTEKRNGLVFDGVLDAADPPLVDVAPGSSPAGYIPLGLFGIPPIPGVGDETIVNFNVPAFRFGGETWTRIGAASNGYAVVGGGTADDIQATNQILPDVARPNNVLAPFWTDLDPSAGGSLRAGILTDGVNDWLILDWENVVNFEHPPEKNSFQVWIGLNGVEDISFVYGAVTGGAGGLLTVGAENKFGNRGANVYANGTGTLPGPATELVVTSTPGAPADPHVITFSALGAKRGRWENCAEMTSES